MPIPHQPIARNFAVASENKIHSDGIAKRLGFTGALVPGVAVFGHLTWPLTEKFGERWLTGSWVTTRFLKPAYDGEKLTITYLERDGRHFVECLNDAGVLLATLECNLNAAAPHVDARAEGAGSTTPMERVEITWDSIHVDRPFSVYVWTPDVVHNAEYAARLDDDTAVFQLGVLHPHAILSQANQVLVRRYIMPAWIHTGSEIRFRKLLRVDDEIEVRAVPIEKWERPSSRDGGSKDGSSKGGGHQFIKLYIAYLVKGQVATEIYHTAIFRVAEK